MYYRLFSLGIILIFERNREEVLRNKVFQETKLYVSFDKMPIH